jgi:hypothetical protein
MVDSLHIVVQHCHHLADHRIVVRGQFQSAAIPSVTPRLPSMLSIAAEQIFPRRGAVLAVILEHHVHHRSRQSIAAAVTAP